MCWPLRWAALLGLTVWCSENCPGEGQDVCCIIGGGLLCILWWDTNLSLAWPSLWRLGLGLAIWEGGRRIAMGSKADTTFVKYNEALAKGPLKIWLGHWLIPLQACEVHENRGAAPTGPAASLCSTIFKFQLSWEPGGRDGGRLYPSDNAPPEVLTLSG